MHYSLSFDIDGKYVGPMPYVVKNPNELHVVYQSSGLVTLPELSEGSHSLTVNLLVSPSNDHIKPSYSNTIYFSIDLTPPNVTILSPANQTYTVANISEASFPLDFTVDENAVQTLLLGLIFSTFGFSISMGLIIFGLLLIIAAVALGVEFGFIEGKGTMGSTSIFRSPQKRQRTF
jgi:hypothetical protein